MPKKPDKLQSLEWNRYSEIIHPAYEIFDPKLEFHNQKFQEEIYFFENFLAVFGYKG